MDQERLIEKIRQRKQENISNTDIDGKVNAFDAFDNNKLFIFVCIFFVCKLLYLAYLNLGGMYTDTLVVFLMIISNVSLIIPVLALNNKKQKIAGIILFSICAILSIYDKIHYLILM